MIGADYSLGRPGGAALAAAGVQAVGRYAATGRSDVNITAAEVADLRGHGLDVFIFNEHESGYMLRGATRAASATAGALTVTRAAGLPDGVIFYSADFDATLGGAAVSASALQNMARLVDFLTGAARVTGWEQVGIYGGYYTVAWLLDHVPELQHAVQTSAWSSGRWDPRVFARQDGYNWTINGVNCDHLTVVNPDDGSLRYRKGSDTPVTPDDIKALAAATADALGGRGSYRDRDPYDASGKTPLTWDRILNELYRRSDDPRDLPPAARAALVDAVASSTAAKLAQGLHVDPSDPAQLRTVLGEALDEHLASLRITNTNTPPAAAQ